MAILKTNNYRNVPAAQTSVQSILFSLYITVVLFKEKDKMYRSVIRRFLPTTWLNVIPGNITFALTSIPVALATW